MFNLKTILKNNLIFLKIQYLDKTIDNYKNKLELKFSNIFLTFKRFILPRCYPLGYCALGETPSKQSLSSSSLDP